MQNTRANPPSTMFKFPILKHHSRRLTYVLCHILKVRSQLSAQKRDRITRHGEVHSSGRNQKGSGGGLTTLLENPL